MSIGTTDVGSQAIAAKSADTSPLDTDTEAHQRNIETVLDFYAREEEKISGPQWLLERIGDFIGQPMFPGIIVLFVALWIAASLVLPWLGIADFDPAPFLWLQGIVGLGAFLTATVVLIKQNRLAKLEEQRAHLDLKVNLMTEQKAAKLIKLIEELRHDLPNVRVRHDPEAAVLQESMSPDRVIAALDERSDPEKK